MRPIGRRGVPTRLRAAGLVFVLLGLAVSTVSLLADAIVPAFHSGFGPVQIVSAIGGAGFLAVGLGMRVYGSPRWVLSVLKMPVLVAMYIAVGLVLASSVTFLLAMRERGVDFEYDRTTGPQKIYHRVFRQAGMLGVRVCRCEPDTEDTVRIPGGFEMPVSIYDRGGAIPRPGVVIVHGNAWLGRRLSFYRLLATLLAERGYIVATFDRPGFGGADDPFGKGPQTVRAAYDHAAQIGVLIRYLVDKTPVDARNLAVFGHSGGVGPALVVGAARPEISRIIVMVSPTPPPGDPQRETLETYLDTRFRKTYEFVYERSFPEWFRRELKGVSVSDEWSAFRTPGHKPLLLLLGERDRPEWHESIYTVFNELAEPKEFALLRQSGHYANSGQSLGYVFYSMDAATELVDSLVSWWEGDSG